MQDAKPITSVLGCLISIAVVASAEQPASRPARRWGPTKAGLAVSIEVKSAVDVRRGGKLILSPAIRNSGQTPTNLGAAKDAVAWLILKSQPADGSSPKYYFSATVRPAAGKEGANWPASLASGRQLTLQPTDFGEVKLYPYTRGVKFLKHHITGEGTIPKPAGMLKDVLPIGQVSIQYMLYLRRKGDSPVLLKSGFLAAEIGPPDLKSLSPQRRKAFVADLIAGFEGDAFAGKAAHSLAVSLGRQVVGDLIAAARSKSVRLSGAGRLWLATALADIRDDRSADALAKWLDGKHVGVRHVAAYHGPKQRSDKLDAAIIARASKAQDPRLTALALLGFMVFRGEVPRKLLDAGIDSDDPRVRTTVAAALSQTASEENVRGLVALLKSDEQRVRSAAAKALGAMGNRHATVIGALIAALEPQGDRARTDVCNALVKLTGHKLPYDGGASADRKRKIITEWKAWWAAVTKNHR